MDRSMSYEAPLDVIYRKYSSMAVCNQGKLTLNMLSWFKNSKRYIHILERTLHLAWPKYLKLTLEPQYMLSVLNSQYHTCWCTGDFRSQCIIRHGIDSKTRIILSPASEELNAINTIFCNCICCRKYGLHSKAHSFNTAFMIIVTLFVVMFTNYIVLIGNWRTI